MQKLMFIISKYKINLILLLCPVFFGLTFVLTGSLKLIYSESFVDAVTKLHGIPYKEVVTLYLPTLEICLGISILIKIQYSMLCGLIFNSIFLYVIIFNYLTGNIGVDCGCFGDILNSQIGNAAILRQLTFVVVNMLYVAIVDFRQQTKYLNQFINKK